MPAPKIAGTGRKRNRSERAPRLSALHYVDTITHPRARRQRDDRTMAQSAWPNLSTTLNNCTDFACDEAIHDGFDVEVSPAEA
ncbi:MAG TPA: hypothetical protein VJ865_08740 [Gemmatimonadaceae bacterium]|nr:hypothetical protein [Gemmatimonadaceae bacterium]